MYERPEHNKSKSLTIRALMGNQKLRQTLEDGLNSPPGSTKRKKAATLLRSLSSINKDRMDGQGGGLDLSSLGYGSPKQQPTYPGSTQNPLYGSGLEMPSNQLQGNISGINMPSLSSGQKGTATVTTAPSTSQFQGQGNVAGINIPNLNNKPLSPASPQNPKPTTQYNTPIGPEPAADPGAPAPNQPMAFAPSISDIQSQFLFRNDASQLTPAQSTAGAGMFDAALSSGGAQSFSYRAMNDPAFFAKATGLPESAAPKGASLAGQLEELYNSTKKAYALEEQENNLRNMQTTGMTLMSDLGAYTKGKDEYIKQIDTLLEKTKKNMYEDQDMSNPYTRNAMNQYLDYLNIIKGRQELRYSDMIKASADQYNAQINFALDKLNADKEKFLIDYQNKSAYTTEDFNNTKSFLMELYNNLSTVEEKSYNMGILKNQWLQSEAQILQMGMDQPSSYNRYMSDYNNLLKPYTQTVKAGAVNVPMINGDISEIMAFAAQQKLSDTEMMNPGDVLLAIADNIRSAAPAMVEAGMTKELIDNYKQKIVDYYSQNYNLPGTSEQMAAYKEAAANNAFALINPLVSKTLEALSKKILNEPTLVTNIQDAINDMIGTGWFAKPMVDKKDEWIKANSAVDPGILNLIYNNITNGQRANIGAKEALLTAKINENGNTKSVVLNKADQLTPVQIIDLLDDGLQEEFILIK